MKMYWDLGWKTILTILMLTAFLNGKAHAEDNRTKQIWSAAQPFPATQDIQLINQKLVKYRRVHTAVRPHTFAIGAALVDFNGTLYSSWAANPDGVAENQGTEFVSERTSTDRGATWSDVRVLAPQIGNGAFHSHGSYFVQKNKLYFFAKQGPFTGPTKAFELNADGQTWIDHGVVTAKRKTFWPMDEPQPLKNGQWIMGGLSGEDGKQPAVAIANEDNLFNWQVTLLPNIKFKGFGETTVVTRGNEVLAISRNGALKTPMFTRSVDAGQTWEPAQQANMPMVPAKPYAGRLKDGRPYLVCNVPPEKTAEKKSVKRSRLCLLLGPVEGMSFDRVWLLRSGEPPVERFSGPQHNPQWAYPYAHESEKSLFIVHHNAKEDVEMIEVPLEALQ